MSTATYTGYLTDVGLGLLVGKRPELTVRPEVHAFGPRGPVAAVRVPVPLNASTNQFTMTLIPSGELTDAVTGITGVSYVLDVGRFDLADDLTKIWRGTDAFRFTAVAGGGNVGEMAGGSLLAVWVGPPWPATPLPKGLYIDQTPPNPWGIQS